MNPVQLLFINIILLDECPTCARCTCLPDRLVTTHKTRPRCSSASYFGFFFFTNPNLNHVQICVAWIYCDKKLIRYWYVERCRMYYTDAQRRRWCQPTTMTTKTATTIQSCASENCEFILCSNNYVLRAVGTISRQHEQQSICHLSIYRITIYS